MVRAAVGTSYTEAREALREAVGNGPSDVSYLRLRVSQTHERNSPLTTDKCRTRSQLAFDMRAADETRLSTYFVTSSGRGASGANRFITLLEIN
jgi:hypothetical protein